MSSDTTSSYLTSRWGGRILRPVSRKRDEHDKLDDWLDIWTREIPNLDPVTEGIVERIQNLYKDFDRSMEETLTKHDLDRRAFHLLGRLRSYGPPYRRTPGQLAGDMRLSSGAMTNRLDRLEAAGLIRRLPDPNDRRGQLIDYAAGAIWRIVIDNKHIGLRRELMNLRNQPSDIVALVVGGDRDQ